LKKQRINESTTSLRPTIRLFEHGAEAAAAEGEAVVDAALRSDARPPARGAAALGDDPDLARPVVDLVCPADEGHGVAVLDRAGDADLLVVVAVGVVENLSDGGLLACGLERGGAEQEGGGELCPA
jgi:hypothetical protein